MENPMSKDENQLVENQILKLKETDEDDTSIDHSNNLFNGNDKHNERFDDLIDRNVSKNNEEKENEEENQTNRSNNHLNEDNHDNNDDIQMDNEELNRLEERNSSSDFQMVDVVNDECMRRRIRMRQDINKRKLRHLNNSRKRREQNRLIDKNDYDDESFDEEFDDEINDEQISKEIDKDNEQSTNQSSNIIDLLNKSANDRMNKENDEIEDEDEPNDNSIKKTPAYLGLQRLFQFLQQQSTSTTNQDDNTTEPISSDNQLENTEKTFNNSNIKSPQASSIVDNQQTQSDQNNVNNDWLMNMASATFPMEKSQNEALSKQQQSPTILHQRLMMVQLLQQLQQQATANESTNEEEKSNELENNENKKLDEPMDCDQQQLLTNSMTKTLFDYQKSKLNFGNLTPSNLTHPLSTSTTGAPVPTKPAHTLNPISTSSSLFTSSNSSINSINNLNRLNSMHQSQTNNSTNFTNRSNPIDNLILMPDELNANNGEMPTPSKNPLELLQHTAEKALQKTMKGASFLVNGDNEDNENKSDDPSNRHKCKFCEKIFGSDSALQIHIRSHTGERPFKCNVCGNRFSTKGNLKVHFTRHAAKYPHIKMITTPVPEHLDRLYPVLEPPGCSQSPPAQYLPEDDILSNVNNIGLNFAQGLAAAAAASQQTLNNQQKQRQQLQDMNMLANLQNLSNDRLDSFSRELLLASTGTNNFLLKNSSSSLGSNEKQLRDLTGGTKSPAATKQETIELDDDTISKLNSSTVTSSTNKENNNQLNEEAINLNMNMLDYLLKSKQRKQSSTTNTSTATLRDNQNEKSSNVNNLLNELNQQLNPNFAATIAAAQAASSLFSFLPNNLHSNIYQQLPQYLSSLLQHQFSNANQSQSQQQHQSQQPQVQQHSVNNVNSPVANLLNDQQSKLSTIANSNNQTSPINDLDSLNQSQNNQNSLIKTSSASPTNQSPNQTQSSNLLGNVLNNNSMITNRSSTGRNSPNSSLNSTHDLELNSVLSLSPRNSPNIRQQLSQLAALTASTSTGINNSHHQLIQSPIHHSSTTTTPSQIVSNNSNSTPGMNAYQDLLPKPGSTDNAWETLMEVEKDIEAAKLKKLVENCDQKITDPNQCIICQRILSCKSALQMHYRVHTGERPFKCKLCQRAFTTKGNLKTHMSVHRQKPSLRSMHECPVCRQPFTNALVLQQHVKQNHQHNQDERQLIQAHQKQQQQLQYAVAMERMLMAHQNKSGNGDQSQQLPLGLPNFGDDSFLASLNAGNFNLAQLQALHNSMSMDRQSSIDENSFQEAARQFLNQNGRFNMSEMGKEFDDDDFDDKDDDMMNDCEEDDLANASAQPMRDDDEDELDKDEELIEDDEMLQKNENTESQHNLSPSNNSTLNNSQQQQIDHMNEDSIASTLSSSAGAIDLTPKQQEAVASHLLDLQQQQQQLNNSNGLNQSGNSQLNIPTMPAFQLSARGANTTCRICLKTFACNSALEIHYRSHTKERPFKCTVCERGFSTKGNMKQHLMTHKLRDFPANVLGNVPNINVSGNNQLSSLMLNAAAAAMNGNLAGVINSANGLGENCLLKSTSSSTTSSSTAKTELNEDERASTVNSESSSSSIPNLANNDLKRMNSLTNSISSNLTASLSTANGATSTSSMSSSNVQNNNSSGELKHMCEICVKPFSSHSALQIHLRTHTGDKPFQCNICSRRFTTKGNLKVHMGTHMSGMNPHINILSPNTSRRGRRMSLEMNFQNFMMENNNWIN